MKALDRKKLRREFWVFVTNRLSRGENRRQVYEMKIIHPPCKTIKICFSQEDELVEIMEEILQSDEERYSKLPSEAEFKKMVWNAWDSRV